MSFVRGNRKFVRRLKTLALASIMFAIAGSGCKTQDDAAAAASQMAETAKTLCSYYTALSTVVAETQDVYQAQYSLTNLPPEDLSETLAQLKMRADMALEIGKVSDAFQKISGSTAAKDASAAAGSLNTELVTIKALASDDKETKAVTDGVQLIVMLLQEHDEVRAAKSIAPLAHNLSVFFDSERAYYDSLNQAYLVTSQDVAKDMVRKNQVDVSPVFLSALKPFDMAPKLDQSVVGPGMQAYLNQQIAARYKSQLEDGKRATEGVSSALKEMDKRIALVAGDKPMNLKVPPVSLEAAESWIQTIKNRSSK